MKLLKKIISKVTKNFEYIIFLVLLFIVKLLRYCYISKSKYGNKKLALMRFDGLGDLAIWLQIAKYYRELYAEYEITLFCRDSNLDLVQHCNLFDRIIPVNREKLMSATTMVQQWLKLDRTKYDILINDTCSSVFYTNEVVSLLINADVKVTVYGDNWFMSQKVRKLCYKFYDLILPLEINDNNWFEGLRYFNFICQLYNYNNKQLIPVYQPIDNLFKSKFNRTIKDNYIVINLGAFDLVRAWRVRDFVQVVNYEKLLDYKIVLIGGAEEIELASEFVASFNNDSRLINLVGKTSLFELLEVVKYAKLSINNDTSTSHIAAALNVPSITIVGGGHIIGPRNLGRFMPYPEQFIPDNYNRPMAVYLKMSCFGCNWNCVHELTHDNKWLCVANVSVEAVVRNINMLF